MNTKRSLIVYTAAHFAVDFACFFMLAGAFYSNAQSQTAAVGLLAYNFIAFALQPIIGRIADARPFPTGPLGCFLVAIGLAMDGMWLTLCLCALGNAMFHVGGGIDALAFANGKMRRPGIFVSSGALGVTVGTVVARFFVMQEIIPICLMLAFGILIALLGLGKEPDRVSIKPFHAVNGRSSVGAAVVLLVLLAAARSYAGSVVPMQWREGSLYLMLLPAACACAGKLVGGFVCDALGAKWVCTVSLGLSVPLILLFYDVPALCALGVFLFNIPMAAVLCALSDSLSGSYGLAFGINAFALFLGVAPTFMLTLGTNTAAIAASALCTVACMLFIVILSNGNKQKDTEEKA